MTACTRISMSDPGALPSVVGAVLRGSLAQNRMRVALAMLAIALGVALGFAVQLINESAVSELAQGVQTLSGAADLEVRGPRAGFGEALYPVLARWPGVAAASPIVEVDAKLAGRDDTLRIVGIDAFRASIVEPALVPPLGDRLDALRSDTIFLTPAASRWLGASEDAPIHAQSGLADVPLRIGGILASGGAQRFAVMDIAGVQAAFGRIGRLTRIDLRLAPGVDVASPIGEP